jgi:hypothetical protein
MITKIIADNETHGHIPEYDFVLDGDIVEIVRREAPALPSSARRLVISDDAREKGRKAAKGWDIYALETEWRDWIESKSVEVQSADAHFVAFCKKRGPIKR